MLITLYYQLAMHLGNFIGVSVCFDEHLCIPFTGKQPLFVSTPRGTSTVVTRSKEKDSVSERYMYKRYYYYYYYYYYFILFFFVIPLRFPISETCRLLVAQLVIFVLLYFKRSFEVDITGIRWHNTPPLWKGQCL